MKKGKRVIFGALTLREKGRGWGPTVLARAHAAWTPLVDFFSLNGN
ncbi:hypothetical protein CCACVL1_12939 [Corchorus capsularis]|uniref:Uncharacterized protein n=1 Tax=Corchorus capsularis TaxID=210143 RepID=A0A1R3ID33_COCAP|nr:hypothetical protein CCACVL1_12939 [Corchorus capsularis]